MIIYFLIKNFNVDHFLSIFKVPQHISNELLSTLILLIGTNPDILINNIPKGTPCQNAILSFHFFHFRNGKKQT